MNGAEFIVARGGSSKFTLLPPSGGPQNQIIEGSVFETVSVELGGTFDVKQVLMIEASLTNFAQINVMGGTLTTHATQNSGTITVFAGKNLELGDGHSIVELDSNDPEASGSTINGTGQAKIMLGANVKVFGTANVANVIDYSTTMDGTGTLQINGIYESGFTHWDNTIGIPSGTVQVGSQTNPNAKLVFLDIGNDREINRKLVNWGTVEWALKKDLAVGVGGSIENKPGALFDIKVDQTLIKDSGAGNFKNNGTLKKSDGNGMATIQLDPDPDTGDIQVEKGTLKYKGKLHKQSGQISISPAATLALDDGIKLYDGTIGVPGTATMTVIGTFEQLDGDVFVYGNNAIVSVTGTFNISGGTVLIDNEAEVAITGTMVQSGGTVSLGASLSDLTVSGSLQQTGGRLSASYLGAHINVAGSVTVSSGATLELLFGGQIIAGGGVTLQSGGILNAYLGEVVGTLVNGGTINLNLDGVPYTLYVDGNYTQTSTGILNVTLTDDSTTARLKVTGTATLGGTLNVALDGVSPSDGSSYTIVEADTLSGAFATLNPPPLGSGQWVPQFNYGDPFDTFTLWMFE